MQDELKNDGASRTVSVHRSSFVAHRLVRLFAGLLLLLGACARVPVTEELTIEPDAETDTVVVTASTKFLLNAPDDRLRERVETARSAAMSGTDPWSIRFARLSTPEEERVTYQKNRGALEQVIRSARIPSDDLQHLMSDTSITVDVVRGEGWRELAFYPGSSGRATREQQREMEAAIAKWSASVARYFTAMHHLYAYLDRHPHREREVFEKMLSREEDALPVTEEEAALLETAGFAMGEIVEEMYEHEGRAATLAEQVDLVFNPFPARIIVRVPGDVISREGFTGKGGELRIEPVDLLAALGSFQGRWISPDPLAAILREEEPTAEQLAAAPRKSQAVVSSGEIAGAIREQLARPRAYSVRWRD